MEAGKLPKAQFIARVNKTCREAWAIIFDNFAQYSSWQDERVSQRKRFSEAIRLSLMAGIDFHIFDNVRRLGAPKREESDIEDIVGPMQEAIERGQRLGPLHSIAEVEALFSKYNERARRYGLDDCLVDAQRLRPIES
ncbi:MAG TPA: hypothetical protein VK471_02380 [Solirubrobacterales bacterium]|nr:hypothetical protein [Solirubrobacterales bacterium]